MACVSLAGSAMCPGYSNLFINPTNLATAWPLFNTVTDVASFDTAFDSYLNPTTGQFAKTKQLNQLGCSGYRSGFVLQYEQSFLCGEFTSISYSASCNTNATAVADTKTCQSTCYQFADSEINLVNNTLICGQAYNATREATLTRDFTSCTDWTSLTTNNTATCVQGMVNEANCGFRNSTTQLCNYCDTTSGNKVDACCVNANTDLSTCGYTVNSADVISSPTSGPSSSASQPSGTSAPVASSHHGLSKGQIAGAVVGSVVGALFLLIALILLCLFCRRRRANRSVSSEGIEGGAGPMMAENSTMAETYASDKAANANATNPAFGGAAAAGTGASPASRNTPVFPSKPQAPSPTQGYGTGVAAGAAGPAAGAAGAAALHDGYAASRTHSHQESLGSTVVPNDSGRILVSAFQDLYSEGTIVSGSHVVVLYSYKASLGDELTLAVGQSIQVISLYDDDWASGRLIGEDGKVLAQGAFPLVCVSLVGDTTTTTSPSSMSDEEIAATRGEESANAGYTDGEYATAGEEDSDAAYNRSELSNAVRR